jgi:hypothetical protein
MTGKGYGKSDKRYCMYKDDKSFADIQEALTWLKEQYPTPTWKHKQPMFVETKDGKVLRVGFIVSFRADDISHVPVQKWLQQDWVEFQECRSLDLSRQEEVKPKRRMS